MNPLTLALSLALLPPAAHLHNEQAMSLDEAGRLDEAADEFAAAYAAMPDPDADREGREQVLGSLRGLLLRQHQQTGAPQPLCRLRTLLQDHVAALAAAHPEPPEPRELAGNRERLVAVDAQLASYPPDACTPAPVAAATQPPAAPPPTVTPPPRRPPPARPVVDDGPTPRQLRIAGGVSLGIGAALLGVMTYGIVREQREAAAGRDIDAAIVGRPIVPAEWAALQDHRDQARFSKSLAIGTGISSAVFSLFSVALLVTANNKARKTYKSNTHQNSVLMAPMRLPSGAGLTFLLPLP